MRRRSVPDTFSLSSRCCYFVPDSGRLKSTNGRSPLRHPPRLVVEGPDPPNPSRRETHRVQPTGKRCSDPTLLMLVDAAHDSRLFAEIVCRLWTTLMTTQNAFGGGWRFATGVRRRRRTAEEKGRIVAEAIAPDAVIAEVARPPRAGAAASVELDPGGERWAIGAARRGRGGVCAGHGSGRTAVQESKSTPSEPAGADRDCGGRHGCTGSQLRRSAHARNGGTRGNTGCGMSPMLGAAGTDPGTGGDQASGLPQRDERACAR